MNLYPHVERKVQGNDGREHTLIAQIAPYSLHTAHLVIDVGETNESAEGRQASDVRGFPVDSKRITLELDPKTIQADADVRAALELAFDLGAPYAWVKCVREGCPRWRLDTPRSNRCVPQKVKRGTGEGGGDTVPDRAKPLCETCFLADLDAAWKKSQARETAKRQRDEAKLYLKGYRWAVYAWVHPKQGGDDYQVTYYYVTEPTAEVVVRELAKVSRTTDDRSPPRPLPAPPQA